MQKLCIFFLLVLFNASITLAAQTKVKSLRISSTAEKTRIVFDLSAIPKHKVFQLDDSAPARLVIDFFNAGIDKELMQSLKDHPVLKSMRTSDNKKSVRVVFDLQEKINYKKIVLNASGKYGPRLVIDLPFKNNQSLKRSVVKTAIHTQKPFIVAVDAGHGGKDPGARGKYGTLEKKVVFDIAQKLTLLINQQAGMKAIMVRKGDYFVPLRERIKIARKADADLIVSIHADSVNNSKAKGASVYTLSRHGASNEAARLLADSENSVDMIGGINLDDKNDEIASLLLDLAQSASQDISQVVAKDILNNVGRIGELHSSSVLKAGFVVLKSPDIPSILVETAFISNPKEEKKLKSTTYQLKLAQAIKKGIMSYAEKHALALNASAFADTSVHKISKGETLSGIAMQYGVSIDQLKRANRISKSNHIRAGQVLSIPIGI